MGKSDKNITLNADTNEIGTLHQYQANHHFTQAGEKLDKNVTLNTNTKEIIPFTHTLWANKTLKLLYI